MTNEGVTLGENAQGREVVSTSRRPDAADLATRPPMIGPNGEAQKSAAKSLPRLDAAWEDYVAARMHERRAERESEKAEAAANAASKAHVEAQQRVRELSHVLYLVACDEAERREA